MEASAVRPAGALSTARLVLEAMRPRQWVKNVFVLGGLLFSGEFVELGPLATAVAVFVAFCLASGAAYLVNDVVDAETDRLNPRTAARPIARGELSPRTAHRGGGARDAGRARRSPRSSNWQTLATLGRLHRAPGRVLVPPQARALRRRDGHRRPASCCAPTPAWWRSTWGSRCGCSSAPACSRSSSASASGAARRSRWAAAHTRSGACSSSTRWRSIDELIAVVTPSIIVAYSLYAVLGARTQLMLLTVPFVIYGVFRVLYLIHHGSRLPDDPTEVVWRDRPLQACIVLWGIGAGLISALCVACARSSPAAPASSARTSRTRWRRRGLRGAHARREPAARRRGAHEFVRADVRDAEAMRAPCAAARWWWRTPPWCRSRGRARPSTAR